MTNDEKQILKNFINFVDNELDFDENGSRISYNTLLGVSSIIKELLENYQDNEKYIDPDDNNTYYAMTGKEFCSWYKENYLKLFKANMPDAENISIE